jgi:outer membrane receptor protein involved in Fe transport
MRPKTTAFTLLILFATSATSLAMAQTTGKGNASTSAGAANADVMAPGGTGNIVPKGAGDTTASGVPSAANSKRVQRKGTKTKSRSSMPVEGVGTSR